MTALPFDNNIIIRPMLAEDLEQVQAIDQASFSMPWPQKAYHYELNENPRSLLFVAEASLPKDQMEIIGMIVVWLILDEAHIATLAVRPDYREQGIAQRLLSSAMQEAIRKGSKQATLEVRANNIPAQRLYQRFNFVVVGRRRRYYRDNNEDAVLMTATSLGEDYLKWLKRGMWAMPQPAETPGGIR